MNFLRDDLKVFGVVVEFVAVYVMNLVALGDTPKEIFRYAPMHEFPAALGPIEKLSIAIEVSN